MAALVLIASFEATAETREDLRSRLTEMVELTQPETGCLRYELHVDNNNQDRFVFVETWASRTSWDQHMERGHVKALLADLPRLTRHGVDLLHLTPV